MRFGAYGHNIEVNMRKYAIELTGTMPLLMHADDVCWADEMEEWKSNPDNKKSSKAGDDRTPAYRWIGYCYNDGENVCVPTDLVMACIMKAGALVPVPGGKNGKTFKSQAMSGILPDSMYWDFFANGAKVTKASLDALRAQPDFKKHMEAANDMGFSLFVKRAAVGQSKHIRVRPRFDQWMCRNTVTVIDEQITEQVLANIFRCAGMYKGLGDWRPGGKTPGPFGTFEAKIQAV